MSNCIPLPSPLVAEKKTEVFTLFFFLSPVEDNRKIVVFRKDYNWMPKRSVSEMPQCIDL